MTTTTWAASWPSCCVSAGRHVTLVTPRAIVSSWTTNTMEQHRIQRRLLELDVEIVASHAVVSVAADAVRVTCVFTGRERDLPTGAAVFVTARLPQDAIYRELLERRVRWAAAGLQSVKAVGDCLAPGTIAAAVWEGHRYAEELDEPRRSRRHRPLPPGGHRPDRPGHADRIENMKPTTVRHRNG